MNMEGRPIGRLAIIGFLVGMVVGNGITMSFASSSEGISLVAAELADEFGYVPAVIMQTMVSGLAGAVCFGGTYVYQSERYGILSATLIHMALAMCTMIPVANLLWWTDRTLEGSLLFLAFISMIYLLIWVSIYASYRAEVRRINDALEKRRSGKPRPSVAESIPSVGPVPITF